MKDFLSPKALFSLENTLYPSLFEEVEFCWELLKKIAPFLESQSLGKIEVEIPPLVHLENPELISIGEGSVVEPGAYIKGPCLLGKNCVVRQGSYIRGNVLAEDNVVIGHTTEAKNCLFLEGAQAAHFAYLGDSVLGRKVNLGAGTKLANLKLDHKEVIIHAAGDTFHTGLRKFGAIIGDGAQIGCNAVTHPGTIIGKGAFWFPCVSHGGVVPSNCVVRPKERAEVIERKDIK